MILNFWDDTLFSWESVAGQNLRYQISDNIISVFPYLDSFDTSRNVLHVSISLTDDAVHIRKLINEQTQGGSAFVWTPKEHVFGSV